MPLQQFTLKRKGARASIFDSSWLPHPQEFGDCFLVLVYIGVYIYEPGRFSIFL